MYMNMFIMCIFLYIAYNDTYKYGTTCSYIITGRGNVCV